MKGARRFDKISYIDVLQKGLSVMDSTAISLCMDNKMPIIVFDMNVSGNLRRVVMGDKVGSLVRAEFNGKLRLGPGLGRRIFMTTIATTKDALAQSKVRMEKAVEDFRKELAGVRTGRANVSLLDSIRVDYHENTMPINKLGTLSVPGRWRS